MTSEILIHVLKDHLKPDKISNKIGSHTNPLGLGPTLIQSGYLKYTLQLNELSYMTSNFTQFIYSD